MLHSSRKAALPVAALLAASTLVFAVPTPVRAADIVQTSAFSGAEANYLRPSIVAAGLDPDTLKPKGSIDANAAQSDARPWAQIWAAGQAVGQVRAVEPLARMVERLADEYAAAVAAELRDPWVQRYAPRAASAT